MVPDPEEVEPVEVVPEEVEVLPLPDVDEVLPDPEVVELVPVEVGVVLALELPPHPASRLRKVMTDSVVNTAR